MLLIPSKREVYVYLRLSATFRHASEYYQQCEYLTLSKRHLEEHHGDKLPLPGVRGQKLDAEIKRLIEHEDDVALIRGAKRIKLTFNACIHRNDR